LPACAVGRLDATFGCPMTTAAVTADQLAELLQTLVDIPSVTGQEGPIADWLATRLEGRAGGPLTRSGHGLGWRGAPAPEPTPVLVLAGHIDTVPAQGNTVA